MGALEAAEGGVSIEVWEDAETSWLRCAFGNISLSSIWPSNPGVIPGMGPLMLVVDPVEVDIYQLAHYGVELSVANGIARTVANNGTWLHRLLPAHWRNGIPPVGWSPFIMLGVWPD